MSFRRPTDHDAQERFNAETRSAWEMVYDLMSTIMLLA